MIHFDTISIKHCKSQDLSDFFQKSVCKALYLFFFFISIPLIASNNKRQEKSNTSKWTPANYFFDDQIMIKKIERKIVPRIANFALIFLPMY